VFIIFSNLLFFPLARERVREKAVQIYEKNSLYTNFFVPLPKNFNFQLSIFNHQL